MEETYLEDDSGVPEAYQDRAIALMNRFMVTAKFPPVLSAMGIADPSSNSWQEFLNKKLDLVYEAKPEFEAQEVHQALQNAVTYYFLTKSTPVKFLEERGITLGDEETVLEDAAIDVIGAPAAKMMVVEMRQFCPPLTKD